MLGGGNVRSKVSASCLEVLRTLATCSFWVRGFKDKNTVHECTQGSKTTYKLQRMYWEVKKQEPTYESQVSSFKCNKQCTRDVFREWNKRSKRWFIYLEALKHEQSYVR